MACNIQLDHVNLIIAPATSGQPNKIRVMGRASACPGDQVIVKVTAAGTIYLSPPTSTNGTGHFVVTFTLPFGSTLKCDDLITVEVTCAANSSCKLPVAQQQQTLKCCEVIDLTFYANVPAGSLNPFEIVVKGTLLGCFDDQVIVGPVRNSATGSPVTGQSLPTLVDSYTGDFTVTLSTITIVNCDEELRVEARCAQDPSCKGESPRAKLNCLCYRAKASIHTPIPPCVGSPPTQNITFDATIELSAGEKLDFQWDFGDTNFGPVKTFDNSLGTATLSIFYQESNDYLIGSYTAKLAPVPLPELCSPVLVSVNVECCPLTVTVDTPSTMCISGKRRATLTVHVTQPAGQAAAFQWDWGDGSPLYMFGITGNTPAAGHPETHDYIPRTTSYPAILKTFVPQGCPDIPVAVLAPPCPPPPCKVLLDYSPKPVPCIHSGESKKIDFEATLDPVDPAYVGPFTWEITKGGQSISKVTQCSPAFPSPPTTWIIVSEPHKFSYTFTLPDAYDVTVTILTPLCPDPTDDDVVHLLIKDCCPTFTSQQLIAQQDPNNPCLWIFSAQVDNPNNVGLQFDWWFENNALTAQTSNPLTTHLYPTGWSSHDTVRVRMSVPLDPACAPIELTTIITPICDQCPTVGTPSQVVTGCAPGTAAVALSTSVSPPVASSFDWSVTTPGGTLFTKTTAAASTTDGTSDGPWTDTSAGSTGPLDLSAPGAYAVTVNAKGPSISSTCPPSAPRGFTIPACSTGTGGEGIGCMLARWIAVALLILAGLAFVLAACVFSPPVCNIPGVCQQAATLAVQIGGILAVAGLVLLLVWLIFCPTKPCAWGWLIAGQVLLGVGLVALHFTTCCPQLWIIGGISTLLGLLSFANWVRLCRVGPCTIARELAVVLVSVVAPIVGWAGSIPLIAVCINTIVRGIVTTVGGLITVAALTCTGP